MKSFLQMLEIQLDTRSTREKFLFSIALALGIYFYIFHSYFLHSLEQITQLKQNIKQSQIYLQSHQTQDIAQELLKVQQLHSKLTTLVHTLNSQSLPIFTTLKKINDYALAHKITLWEADTKEDDSSYQISLVGNAPLEALFSFLHFIENLPLIHLLSFEILENGDFKLAIKNHQILSIFPPNSSLSPELVLQQLRQSLQKEKLIFSFSSPSPELAKHPTRLNFELEALLNKKAKINGNWLRIGERIEEYTLKDIQSNQVILQSKDATLKLQLKNNRVFQ